MDRIGSGFPTTLRSPRPSQDEADRHDLRLVARGDETALLQLLRRHEPAATALATRVTRARFLAEEVVQEAFVSMWRNPDACREDRGTVRNWLLSMVHHRAVDAVRREESQRRRTERAEAVHLVDEEFEEQVVEAADAVASRRAVRRALAELPPEQRRVLELAYFEGKTQVVISKELGVPLGTVKSRTLFGLRRLRALLKEIGGPHDDPVTREPSARIPALAGAPA
jgi:RNA polymerase sigma-70 factor (ECF subfamily)